MFPEIDKGFSVHNVTDTTKVIPDSLLHVAGKNSSLLSTLSRRSFIVNQSLLDPKNFSLISQGNMLFKRTERVNLYDYPCQSTKMAQLIVTESLES